MACGHKFTSKSLLGPFQCEFCGEIFSSAEAPESAAPLGQAESDGSVTDLAAANKEIARLRKIIKEVWDMYENPSQVWWDSDLLVELQDVAEQ